MKIFDEEIPVRCGIMISGDKVRDKVTGNLNVGFFLFEPFIVETIDSEKKKKLFRIESKFLDTYMGGGQELVTWLSSLAKGLDLNAETIEMLNTNFDAKVKEILKENNASTVERLIKKLLK